MAHQRLPLLHLPHLVDPTPQSLAQACLSMTAVTTGVSSDTRRSSAVDFKIREEVCVHVLRSPLGIVGRASPMPVPPCWPRLPLVGRHGTVTHCACGSPHTPCSARARAHQSIPLATHTALDPPNHSRFELRSMPPCSDAPSCTLAHRACCTHLSAATLAGCAHWLGALARLCEYQLFRFEGALAARRLEDRSIVPVHVLAGVGRVALAIRHDHAGPWATHQAG